MEFASPFDEALAHQGPPAVFLPDRHGKWRLHGEWTRSALNRDPGPHAFGWTWTLLRDHASGFVVLALITSPTLVATHPRMAVRVMPSREEAQGAREALGPLAVDPEPWMDAP